MVQRDALSDAVPAGMTTSGPRRGSIEVASYCSAWGATLERNSLVLPISIVGAIFILTFFWPSPYRYESLGRSSGSALLVRVNRFTNRTEIFIPSSGWKERDPGSVPDTPALYFAAGGLLVASFVGGYLLGRRTNG